MAMSSRSMPRNIVDASVPSCLSIMIGILFTIIIRQGVQLTTRVTDSRTAAPEITLCAEDVIAALVVLFAKTQWKKRAAPEPEGANVGDSTTSTRSTSASPKKLPRASTASPAVAPNAATAPGGPRPREGPAVLSVRPYGLEATALWRNAPEGHALWQVQITHDVTTPITKDLWRHFNAHLAALHAEDPEAPSSIRELEDQQSIRLVLTRPDPETAWIGYKGWRVAFYIAARDVREVENFLALWDGFLVYRRRVGRTEGMLDFPMHVHLQRGINVDPTAFDYPDYEVFRDCTPAALPHAVTDAWPPAAPAVRDMLKLVLQFDSESEVTFVLRGPTWPFRERLRALGGRDWEITEEGGTSVPRSFARLWPSICTINPALALSFFAGAVLQEAPVLVYVEDAVVDGTPNAALLDAIRDIPSVARLELNGG